jgi:hypothetical protein
MPTPTAPGRLPAALIPGLLAAAGLALFVKPALHVGFLADDFYMGGAIHRLAGSSGGHAPAFLSGLWHRWTPDFDVLRPLLVLSLQIDHARAGADPAAHHATNLVLHGLLAVLAAAAALRAGSRSLWLLLPGAALVLTSPAIIEALLWCVAREDLLLGIGASLAVIAARKSRPGPVATAVGLALSLAAKETAVVLVPILAFLLLAGTGGERRIRSLAPIALVTALYVLLRVALFDRIGSTYAGQPLHAYLGDPGAVPRILARTARSILALLAPVNEAAWTSRFPGVSAAWPRALALGSSILLVLAAWRARSPTPRRDVLAALALMLLPLLLLAIPLDGVSPDLERSRFLVLPSLGLLLLCGDGIARAAAASWRTALHLGAHLALLILLRDVATTPYLEATGLVERAVASLEGAAAGRSRAVVADLNPGGPGRGISPFLDVRRGAHTLSLGILSATRPPFRAPPGLEVLAGHVEVDRHFGGTPGDVRPAAALVRFVPHPDSPRFEPVLVETDPRLPWRLGLEDHSGLRLEAPGFRPGPEPVEILLATLGGEAAQASAEIPAGADGTVVAWADFVLTRPRSAFGHRLDRDLLDHVQPGTLFGLARPAAAGDAPSSPIFRLGPIPAR